MLTTTEDNTMANSLITSTGTILFMAAKNPIKSFDGDKLTYTIRLEFDGSDPEALTFKKKLAEINDKKIVTDKVSKPGNFIVSFNSTYEPKVHDANGKLLDKELIPRFNSKTDSGKAIVVANISDKGKRPTVYLKEIQILDLQSADTEEDSEYLTEIQKKLQSSSTANS